MNILLKTIHGSRLYGTHSELSDSDYKHVFLPDLKDLLMCRKPKSFQESTGNNNEKNTSEDIDKAYYSIQDFIMNCSKGDMIAFDILHTSEKDWLAFDGRWTTVRENRRRFYSKDLRGLIGYIGKQVHKYGFKGGRVNLLKESIDILTQTMHTSSNIKPRMIECWNLLSSLDNILLLSGTKNNVNMQIIQIAGKKFQQDCPISEALKCLNLEYSKVGGRAIDASNNDNVDWKAVSHAFRAFYQVEELALVNDITFPLKKADFIKEIKYGKFDFPYISELLERKMDVVLDKLMNSNLPDKVDLSFWEEYIYNLYIK